MMERSWQLIGSSFVWICAMMATWSIQPYLDYYVDLEDEKDEESQESEDITTNGSFQEEFTCFGSDR